MATVIFVIAVIVGICSPAIWLYVSWFKAAQSYLQLVILAAEQAIPDNTEYDKLAKIDYALKLYIKYRKLDVERDADAVASIRNAIETAVKGIDNA